MAASSRRNSSDLVHFIKALDICQGYSTSPMNGLATLSAGINYRSEGLAYLDHSRETL
jgi:hypothetical protein